ncbi:MAG TPA: hypothetical protein VKE69_04195 [Planctomycetota bacterium]|nr:hypothetical protein [Planctomycetota bacterium]
MIDPPLVLTHLVGRLLEAADADPALRADREAAWREFLAGRPEDDAMRARFDEWWLFERRSPRLGDAPPWVALGERLLPTLSPAESDLLDELGGSAFGVFELTPRENGVDARDLLSGRSFELEASIDDPADGDRLVVGRLFPTGRGTYVPSAASLLAGGAVASALRSDLGGQRERGARLSQREIEMVLFPPSGEPSYEPIERLEADIERWLGASGWKETDLDAIRRRFLEAETVGEAVDPLLAEAAFDSDVDLEVGRRLLPAYFAALKVRRAPSSALASHDELRARASERCACASGRAYGDCCLARDAVARFEAGRQQGESLDGLIAGLEAAMGVDADDDESEDVAEPAVPPLRPLVDEYLWERAATGREVPAAERGTLESFARSVEEGPGAPENVESVAPAHFDRFLSFERYRGDAAPPSGALGGDVEALERFAQWLRDEQSTDWGPALAPIAARSRDAAERLAAANATCSGRPLTTADRPWMITLVSGDHMELDPIGGAGDRRRAAAPPELTAHLRAGDCIVGSPPEGRYARIFPPGAAPFLARERVA